MSTKILVAFILVSVFSLTKPQAQLRISLNIGVQPIWGPVGYDRVDYYYLPDIETYYNVPSRQYTYMVNGNWITTYSLPPSHRDYDLYSGHKVVINSPRPYLYHNLYREKYANLRNKHDQTVIRDSRDSRYFINKDHPKHGEWKENGHDNRNKNHEDKHENGHDNRDEQGDHGSHGEGHGKKGRD